MATKFIAPVIALALLVIASSVGKAPGKKACCLGEKTRVSLCLQSKNNSPGRSNDSRGGACALIFPLCHCRVPVLSLVRCQTLKSRI